MDNSKTCKFLSETNLAVIACKDNNVVQDFVKYISSEYGTPIAEYSVNKINQLDLSGEEIVIVRGLRNFREQRVQIAQKIKEMKDTAKANNVHFVVPLEKLECEPHLVTAQLRHILFCVPESDKPEINMFNLHYGEVDLKLECEFGKNAGQYLIYDYDASTGEIEEK